MFCLFVHMNIIQIVTSTVSDITLYIFWGSFLNVENKKLSLINVIFLVSIKELPVYFSSFREFQND